MRIVLWILLVVVAILSGAIAFPHSEPATISAAQIFATFAFYPPIFIAGLGVLVSLIDLFCKETSRISAIVMLILSLIFPGSIALRKTLFDLRYDASYAWFDQVGGPGRLNFLIHEYVQQHPNSLSFPSANSEEVKIDGFLDYIRINASLNMPDHSGRVRKMNLRNDGIYTMWGAKIRFAVDRNQDGYIDADGQRGSTLYGYANPYSDRPDYRPGFASAVFITLPDKVVKETHSSMVTLDTEAYHRLASTVLKNTK